MVARGAMIACIAILFGYGSCLSTHASERRYDRWIETYTTQSFGAAVSPRWVKAVGMAESGLRPDARSQVGAVGMFQFMPATFAEQAPPQFKVLGPVDPESSIAVACIYLKKLWNRNDGVATYHRKAFTNGGYNAGPGWITKARAACRSKAGCLSDQWDGFVEFCLATCAKCQQETIGYIQHIRAFERQLMAAGEFL